FVTSSGWVRSNQTVKPDAFIPYPYPDLSVTRHKDLSESEIWRIGQAIANARPAKLRGRADVTAMQVRQRKLEVEARPIPENPKHASITGWPPDKPSQKSFAQELAAVARFVPNRAALR
ncbi:MAG: hypothetical protein L0Z50_36535, partial [Verrucomicrobiales bacterium]|nr:hypothetical protein [Verrucomicrobiales bacterium]